jgi:uncharacterized repeat protein (TIGR03803 family)
VYQLAPTASGEWNETTLYEFSGSDGISPGPLATDRSGDLFGTTYFGGPSDAAFCNSEYGCGVVFELAHQKDGSFKYDMLHAFGTTIASDGTEPTGVAATAGHAYNGVLLGATNGGGTSGNGTVWELSASDRGPWIYSIRYDFQGGTDAAGPNSLVVTAPNGYGAVYGTAGGGNNPHCSGGCGTVFRVATAASPGDVLFRFNKLDGDENGSFGSGLIQGSSGNLYGVTATGGSSGNGVVFEVAP